VSGTLSEREIAGALAGLAEWKLEAGELVRTATFGDFAEAMMFVNAVAELAEAAGHHPDIDIRYNKVRLALLTHDAGGITEKDMSLAEEIDKKSKKKGRGGLDR
jgi:4a-hydroxytetrahydrobiopterin dehydratase